MTSALLKWLESSFLHLEEIVNDNLYAGLQTQTGTETKVIEQVEPGEWVYFGDFVVSLGQRVAPPGVNVYVNRLWANGELIYDRPAGFSKPGTSFTFFDGNESQGEVYRGMHYRGLMTLLFLDFNVTDYGNRVPAITAELLDGTASNTQNVGGAIAAQFPVDVHVGEYHADYDALYRVYYIFGSLFGNRLKVEKVRASTKTLSFQVVILDLTLFGTYTDDSGPTFQFTFIPALGYGVHQAAESDGFKRLYDITSGKNLGSIEAFNAWHGCLSFKVTKGAYTDWFVLGAAETDDELGLLYITGQSLIQSWQGVANDAVRCITVGKQRDGSTDVFITTASEIEKLTFAPAGSAGGYATIPTRTSFYSAVPGVTLRQCWYDRLADRLHVLTVVAGDGQIVSLDASGATVLSSETFVPPAAKSLRARIEEGGSNVSGGTLILTTTTPPPTDDFVTYVDLANGFASTIQIPNNGTTVNDDLPNFWDSAAQTVYGNTGWYVSIGLLPDPENDPDRYTAATVMRAFARFVGYDDLDIFTSDMGSMYVDGYVVSNDTTLARLGNELGQLYGFNWTENNDQIFYKGNYVDGELVIDAVIPEARLALLQNNAPNFFTVIRDTDLSYPAKISLTYFDGENDYKRGFQIASRDGQPVGTMGSDGRIDMSLPLTINGDYALELLYGALYRAWSTKNKYSLRLPADYLALEAGDALEWTAYNTVWQGIVTQSRVNTDNTVSLSIEEAAAARYPVQVATQPTIVTPSKMATPVRCVILDIPSLNDAQNNDGNVNLLVLMAGYIEGTFNGAIFEWAEASDPNGWETKAVIGRDQEAYIGSLYSVFGAWPYPFEVDTGNSIYVTLGTIPVSKMVPATELELDDGANLIAIGEGGDVELVQFAQVEHIGGDVWRLFELRRGRFGTEVFMQERLPGTAVSFLDRASLVLVPYDNYRVYTQYMYRAYSPRQPLWQVDTYRYVSAGNSRKPYAPINVELSRNASTDAINFTFTRRARFYNMPPTDFSVSPPLDESVEQYEIHITLPSDEIRIIEVNPPTAAVYTINDQLNDGLTGEETELTFAVYQVSPDTVGIGLGEYQVEPIYVEGTARLSARFALGGTTTANVVLETNPAITIGVDFEGGGDLTVNTNPMPVRLSATFAGGGDMVIDVPPMTVDFVAASDTVYVTADTFVTVAVPVTPNVGDLIVVGVFHTSPTVSPPSGFTAVNTPQLMTGGTNRYLTVFTKVADGTEANLTFTQAASNRIAAHVDIFRNVHGIPIGVLDHAGNSVTSTGGNMTIPAVTMAANEMGYVAAGTVLLVLPASDPRATSLSSPWVRDSSSPVPENRMVNGHQVITAAGSISGTATFETSSSGSKGAVNVRIGFTP